MDVIPNRLPGRAKRLNLEDGKIAISIEPPPPRDWIVDGLLLAKKSAVLAGFGSVSKTQLAIQLAISVVFGRPFSGKSTKRARAMFLRGEDDRDEMVRRVSAVVRQDELDQD